MHTMADMFIKEIVRLHGIPASIVSDRDSRFISRFWASFQQAMGTQLIFNTAYQPQTDGQLKRTIQTLEEMLRACVLDYKAEWDQDLALCEFAYNNSFHTSICMAPFEALYGRRCRTQVCWEEVGVISFHGPTIIGETSANVKLGYDQFKIAQSMQKSYADHRHRDLKFKVGDMVFLKVSPMTGTIPFE